MELGMALSGRKGKKKEEGERRNLTRFSFIVIMWSFVRLNKFLDLFDQLISLSTHSII
jgi:hypothetical protein